MNRFFNFLRGMVTILAVCPFPERLMNLCAQEGVEFWKVDWLDEHTMRLTTRRRTMPLLRQLAQRAGCEITVERSRGLPDFLLRFRARYAFLVGLFLCMLAVGFLSRFVLAIDVVGNETVHTATILQELRQLGVRPGVYGPSLDHKQLAAQMMDRMEELSYLAINRRGTRLEVIVREAVKPPEHLDTHTYRDIVAETDGLVLKVEARQGDAAVQKGDTVAKGDILISGIVTMEPPKYSDLPPRYYQTRAMGKVRARTWRTITAVIPTTATVKSYTGREKNVWSMDFLGRRIEIFGKSSISWPFYDKITYMYSKALPIPVRRETFRAYELQEADLDLKGTRTVLEQALRQRLTELIGEEGQISSIRFNSRVEGNLLKVTAMAECVEEIGQEVPGTGVVPELHRDTEQP